MQVRKFRQEDEQWWDNFVWQADNGTLFHTRRFLSYHPKDRFVDHSLIWQQKHAVKAVLPAVAMEIDGERVLISHRGSSYGGIVYRDAGIRFAFDLISSLKDYASANGFARIMITQAPLIYATRYSNYLDFAMLEQGFRYRKREISSVLQLTPDIDDSMALFKREARTATRKAQKLGVEIVKNSDYAGYYPILSHNLRLRHEVSPTHTLAELERLHQLFPERIVLWSAYLNGEMIAGVVNFAVTDRVSLAFYISDNKEFQEYRPLNLLFYQIFENCRAHGVRFYDFGIFTVNMRPNWGLGKFKESFGARGLFRDSFECLL
jgi:hypothetical protein